MKCKKAGRCDQQRECYKTVKSNSNGVRIHFVNIFEKRISLCIRPIRIINEYSIFSEQNK